MSILFQFCHFIFISIYYFSLYLILATQWLNKPERSECVASVYFAKLEYGGHHHFVKFMNL